MKESLETQSTDAGASGTPLPTMPVQEAKKPTSRGKGKSSKILPRSELAKRDVLYENVEAVICQTMATEDDPYNWDGQCGYITKWLRGEIKQYQKQPLPASPVVEVTRGHLVEFVRRYRGDSSGSIPTHPGKFANHWAKLMPETRRPAPSSNGNGSTTYRDELDKALKLATHPRTGEALSASQRSIVYDTLNARYATEPERLAALPELLERV
jgi:hypothetical protein